MLYEIQVRPGPNSQFFQYYTETVEALTSHDAVAKVERSNPGCIVHCTNSYNSPNEGSSGLDFSDIGGSALLIALLLLLWVVIEYWHIILPISIIVGILCIIGWFAKED
jgi:hypothetical protein